tara:strand:+ start:561 stop:872 length:312 start_codon:yes stop_codon:yes gene_type:complete
VPGRKVRDNAKTRLEVSAILLSKIKALESRNILSIPEMAINWAVNKTELSYITDPLLRPHNNETEDSKYSAPWGSDPAYQPKKEKKSIYNTSFPRFISDSERE